jgi:hypothetical protein
MIKLERPTCPNSAALDGGNYKHSDNKSALAAASHGKCMYCESKISHIDYAHIEHIKPKAEGKYPELIYVWENLGYSCPKCNINKSDSYYEHTPYIDPYSEEPTEHLISFGALLYQRNGSERGEITIRDIGLNRTDLVEKRLTRITDIQKTLNAAYRSTNESLKAAAIDELKNEALPHKEYSLCVKSFLESHG